MGAQPDGVLDTGDLETQVWMKRQNMETVTRRGCLSPGYGINGAGLKNIWKEGTAKQESSRSFTHEEHSLFNQNPQEEAFTNHQVPGVFKLGCMMELSEEH